MEKKKEPKVCKECGWIQDLKGFWNGPNTNVGIILRRNFPRMDKGICPDCDTSKPRR